MEGKIVGTKVGLTLLLPHENLDHGCIQHIRVSIPTITHCPMLCRLFRHLDVPCIAGLNHLPALAATSRPDACFSFETCRFDGAGSQTSGGRPYEGDLFVANW